MTRRKSPGAASDSGARSPILWTIAIIIFTMVVIGALGLSGLGNVSAARIGSQVDFSLNDFSNKPIHVSDYRGHPVLVNLWASWCPPCRAEMPDLINFYNAHKAEGLVLLAVNSSDDAVSARQFISSQGMPFPVLYDPNGSVERLFHTDGLPSTFLIDKNGDLRFSWTGQVSPSLLDESILPLISN